MAVEIVTSHAGNVVPAFRLPLDSVDRADELISRIGSIARLVEIAADNASISNAVAAMVEMLEELQGITNLCIGEFSGAVA